MTYREAATILTQELKVLYDERESSQLSDWVLEEISGKKKSERLIAISQEMSTQEIQRWNDIKVRLLQGEPIQYVLNQAPFMEWIFYVDNSTLIPRPETEELVAWVLSDHNPTETLKVLDAGTGSGCIAIALKAKRPNWKVIAADNSPDALQVAGRNAKDCGVALDCTLLDMLKITDKGWPNELNLIISNPPYIPIRERDEISLHVKNFEPASALFVPDHHPLQFYESLGNAANVYLVPGGMLYVEIHQAYGKATVDLLEAMGFNVTLKNDSQGNNRMLRAIKTTAKVE